MSAVEIVAAGHCGRCDRDYRGEHKNCDPILRLSDLRVIAEQLAALVQYLTDDSKVIR